MAKYNVEYACGHSGRVDLIGKHRDRERKLEWFAGRDCSDCFKETVDNARAETNEVAAKISLELRFPALTGTEKQIAWATTIRLAAWQELDKMIAEKRADAIAANTDEQIINEWCDAQTEQFRTCFFDVALSAKFFIDYRHCGVVAMVKQFDELN